MANNIDNVNTGIGWLERILQLVSKFKIYDFIKAFCLIIMIVLLVGFVKNPIWIFEQYENYQEKNHKEKMEVRMQNNRKLQALTEKMLYKMDASRIIILELHNGLENANGLPFSKCSATYEALNEGVHPVAQQYQSTNLSLMPFATHLFNEKYWCGDVEELEKIDRGLYHKMAGNGTTHFAATVIEGVDEPLALVFISFQEKPEEHSCEIIEEYAMRASIETAVLLELQKDK